MNAHVKTILFISGFLGGAAAFLWVAIEKPLWLLGIVATLFFAGFYAGIYGMYADGQNHPYR